jgi:hypothetical protein
LKSTSHWLYLRTFSIVQLATRASVLFVHICGCSGNSTPIFLKTVVDSGLGSILCITEYFKHFLLHTSGTTKSFHAHLLRKANTINNSKKITNIVTAFRWIT